MKTILRKLFNVIVLIGVAPIAFLVFLLAWLIMSVYIFVEKVFVFDADGRD